MVFPGPVKKPKGRKRTKAYYKKYAVKKPRKMGSTHPLVTDLKGFLITCNTHEKEAIREAYNLLNEYADPIYGPEELPDEEPETTITLTVDSIPAKRGRPPTKHSPTTEPKLITGEEDEGAVAAPVPGASEDGQGPEASATSPSKPDNKEDEENEEEEEEEDVEDAMAREVEKMQQRLPLPRRFQNVTSPAKNILFIKTLPDINPCQIAIGMFSDVALTRTRKFRYVIRILPIVQTCRATLTDIKRVANEIFPAFFMTPFGTGHTYTILCKVRNNSGIKKETVIPELVRIIHDMNRYNRVNCTAPDYAVIVEIIRGICCFAVLKDYFKYRKYNIVEVSGAEEEPPSMVEYSNYNAYADTVRAAESNMAEGQKSPSDSAGDISSGSIPGGSLGMPGENMDANLANSSDNPDNIAMPVLGPTGSIILSPMIGDETPVLTEMTTKIPPQGVPLIQMISNPGAMGLPGHSNPGAVEMGIPGYVHYGSMENIPRLPDGRYPGIPMGMSSDEYGKQIGDPRDYRMIRKDENVDREYERMRDNELMRSSFRPTDPHNPAVPKLVGNESLDMGYMRKYKLYQ